MGLFQRSKILRKLLLLRSHENLATLDKIILQGKFLSLISFRKIGQVILKLFSRDWLLPFSTKNKGSTVFLWSIIQSHLAFCHVRKRVVYGGFETTTSVTSVSYFWKAIARNLLTREVQNSGRFWKILLYKRKLQWLLLNKLDTWYPENWLHCSRPYNFDRLWVLSHNRGLSK